MINQESKTITEVMQNSLKDKDYTIFESLKHPVCIIGTDGILTYTNSLFKNLINSRENNISLDWEHPLFPEYRRRVAAAYLSAMNGTEKQVFAVIKSPGEEQIPIEIYLFPMFENDEVSSILALLKIVNDRLLSFDRSTLTLISEENFQYDNLHFEFSPLPILRLNENCEIIKCSHSIESFLGNSSKELISKSPEICESIFTYDYIQIKSAIKSIKSGLMTFKRIGEVKILTKDGELKIANLIIYPIIQKSEITSFELIFEDLTTIYELKDEINSMRRGMLLADVTKGFIHSLNNTINVILSKTQLLLQITEKQSVLEGIELIEKSALDIVQQTRRVQNFISTDNTQSALSTEPLVNIIEDAIEFSKMQFKVESKEKNRNITIEKKYYSDASIKTNTKLLKEIIISMLLKVSTYFEKNGVIEVILKKNSDYSLTVKTNKDLSDSDGSSILASLNLLNGIDIRQVAEKINLKIFEEESAGSYSFTAIFPKKLIINNKKEEDNSENFKLRDLDILIVEDEIPLQKILNELFDRMGNRVFVCDNGNEALEEFKKNRYDLLITDYGIKAITGIELAARVREINETITTILLSGWNIDDIDTYDNIVDLFLPKPFKLDELIKSISKIYQRKNKKK